MKWLDSFLKTADKLDFWDTCVNVLEQPDSLIQDATELQQITENGVPLTPKEFLSKVNLLPEHQALLKTPGIEFAEDNSGQLVWIYDPTADIHYFYA